MKDLNQEVIRELLHYDPETGIFTWRKRDRKWFKRDRDWKKWNSDYHGKHAGFERRSKSGYKSIGISILGKDMLAHRIAWLYMEGGEIPIQIDHINRDATDNRWNNIRGSDKFRNNKNLSKRVTNISGFSGVHFHKQSGKWRAEVSSGKKRYSLGLYVQKEDAALAVKEFRSLNGFDEGHGSDVAPYHISD